MHRHGLPTKYVLFSYYNDVTLRVRQLINITFSFTIGTGTEAISTVCVC